MDKQELFLGQQLKERYQVGQLLGGGGMGKVYKAQDIQLHRPVAVKVMSPAIPISDAELQDYTRRFQEEALRLASLKHQGIPHIYEYFEEAGHWFLVMEFIKGNTLEDMLGRQGGHLSVDEVLTIGLQLADVLQYLHQLPTPLIFRDLKPANVMIAPNNQIFLIDFGIARLFTPGKSQDTFVALSQGYAAPEQYGIAQTTVRSDIYSLGATLHHLLSGTHPATRPFLFAPLAIQQPAQLATLIAHMVAIDAANRPESMAVVKEALERMIDQTIISRFSASVLPIPIAQVSPASFPITQTLQHGSVQLSAPFALTPSIQFQSSISPKLEKPTGLQHNWLPLTLMGILVVIGVIVGGIVDVLENVPIGDAGAYIFGGILVGTVIAGILAGIAFSSKEGMMGNGAIIVTIIAGITGGIAEYLVIKTLKSGADIGDVIDSVITGILYVITTPVIYGIVLFITSGITALIRKIYSKKIKKRSH